MTIVVTRRVPRSLSYRRRLFDPVTFQVQEAGLDFHYLQIEQLGGREWGRDHSQVRDSPNLLMPSPDLISAGDLLWDGRGSWLDAAGDVQLVDPWWWGRSDDRGPGWIIRLKYLDRSLTDKAQAMVVFAFQMKLVASMSDHAGQLLERTLFVMTKYRTRMIKRAVERH
jgi:hypothetical protein